MLKQLIFLTRKEPARSILEKSVIKAFKPMQDLLEAFLKGIKPFIILLAAVAIIFQLIHCYQSFHQGRNFNKNIQHIFIIIFCTTLILTYQQWLIPILKYFAGI